MALVDTNLRIEASPMPGTLDMTPQEMFDEYTQRLRILSPTGVLFFVTGDVEPTSNVGPWLKGGDRWYVFDESIKRYVPLNIEDSETIPFHFGADVPNFTPPLFWLRTTHTPTEADPSIGRIIGWYGFDGANWRAMDGIPNSGPTAQRPTNPVDLEKYYDSDISTLIWWERSAWRTVSGVPGDVKFVAFLSFEDALVQNPGWEIFGADNVNLRGRYVSQATKNSGGSPTTVLTVPANVAERAAFETYGETDGVQINPASPVPYPPTVALITLVKV